MMGDNGYLRPSMTHVPQSRVQTVQMHCQQVFYFLHSRVADALVTGFLLVHPTSLAPLSQALADC